MLLCFQFVDHLTSTDFHLLSTSAIYNKHCQTWISSLVRTVLSLKSQTQKFLPITLILPVLQLNTFSALTVTSTYFPWLFPVSPVLFVPTDFTWFSAWTVLSAMSTISVVISSTWGFSLFWPYTAPIHQSWIHLGTLFLGSSSAKKGCRNSYNKGDRYQCILLLRVFTAGIKSFHSFSEYSLVYSS